MNNIASEDEFLSIVDELFPSSLPHMLSPRGHDCVELACPGKIVLSSDLFLEGVHFRTQYFSFEEIGYKALAVNLSDLAASGALPLGFNLNIILPPKTKKSSAAALLRGMSELAKAHSLPLTGGDIARGDTLGLCITIWGKGDAPFLRRANAKEGDYIFIFSEGKKDAGLPLGLARTGLMALEEMGRSAALKSFPCASLAHLRPVPLLSVGHSLAAAANKYNARMSLMDLSDGLARDLPRLLGSSNKKGAEIELPLDILNKELHAFCETRGINPIHHAFKGGEDYLLIGTSDTLEPLEETAKETSCSFVVLGKVSGKVSAKVIGRVTGEAAEVQIYLNRELWQGSGFDHFAAKKISDEKF